MTGTHTRTHTHTLINLTVQLLQVVAEGHIMPMQHFFPAVAGSQAQHGQGVLGSLREGQTDKQRK
jgi:hypothetical protein